MKGHSAKFKQENMLCHRCAANVARTLSQLHGIEELNVDLDSKIVKVIYRDEKVTREMIKEAINESIVKGKIKAFRNIKNSEFL